MKGMILTAAIRVTQPGGRAEGAYSSILGDCTPIRGLRHSTFQDFELRCFMLSF